jgi:hypothetical protein
MDEVEQIQAPVRPAAPVDKSVKLLAFWPTNITAWFASVEGVFKLRGIVEQRAHYFNMLAALPEAMVVLITNLIETLPLPDDSFDRLKACLFTAHQLTDIQKMEKLLSMPSAPGARRTLGFLRLPVSAEAIKRAAHSIHGGGHGRQEAVNVQTSFWPSTHSCITTQSPRWSLTRKARTVPSSPYFPIGADQPAAGAAGRPATDVVAATVVVVSPVAVACRFQWLLRGSWLGSPLGCVRATGGTVTKLSAAWIWPTANGRETRVPMPQVDHAAYGVHLRQLFEAM